MDFRCCVTLGVFGFCLWILLAQTTAEDVEKAARVKRGGGGYHGGGHSNGHGHHGGGYWNGHGNHGNQNHGDSSSEEDYTDEECETKTREACANMNCKPGKYCTANVNDCNLNFWQAVCTRCKNIWKCKKEVCTNGTNSVCEKCRLGYYLDATSKTCKACSPIADCCVATCDGPGSSTCARCDYGYTQSDDKTKCVACKKIENCKLLSCDNAHSSYCYLCKWGYTHNENSTACIECPSRKPIKNCERQVRRNCYRSVCKRCKDGYFVKRGKCQECTQIPDCLDVNCTHGGDSKCLKCKPLYKPGNGGTTCIACPSQSSITHCKNQDTRDCEQSVCIECESGYFPDGSTCQVCPSDNPIDNCIESVKINCKTSECKKCADNYYVNGGTCTECPVPSFMPHCVEATRTCFQSFCKRCEDGYTLKGNICTECPDQPPIEHCVDISKGSGCSDSRCIKCADGYYLDTNKCSECPSRKLIPKCNKQHSVNCSTSVCQQCAEGYYWNQWNGQVCTVCNPMANCLKVSCSNSLDSRCDECKPTYKYDSNARQCVVCPSRLPIPNCKETKIIDCEQNACQKCNEGFYYDTQNCIDCPSKNKILNCEDQVIVDCHTSRCRRCRAGFYSNGDTCEECAIIDKCTDTRCLTDDDQICMSCDKTYRPSSDKKSCVGCPSQMPIPFCRTKQVIDCNLSVCNYCEDGYFPFSNTCKECLSRSQSINNCEEKQILDCTSSTCKKCKAGFFSENNGCSACNAIENCLNVICTDNGDEKCTLCKQTYTYDLDAKKCIACPSQKAIANCRVQTTVNCESSRCEKCEDGYFSRDIYCEDCLQVPNCLAVTCESGNYSKCTSCDDGYKLTIGGKCEVCPSVIPIARCKRQAVLSCDTAVCEQCEHGYYFDGTSCTRCVDIPYCLDVSCSSSDDQQCLKCEAGLKLDEQSKECISCPSKDPIPFCMEQRPVNCDRAVCVKCRDGHFFDGTACKACLPLANCASVKCTSLESSICTSCKDLFMLDSSETKCVRCPSFKVKMEHCIKVKIGCLHVTCEKCEEGYTVRENECKEIVDVLQVSEVGEQTDNNLFSEQSAGRIAIFVVAALGGLLSAAVIIFLVMRYCRKPSTAGKAGKSLKKEIDISTLDNSSNELKQHKHTVPVLNLADVKLVDNIVNNARRYSKDRSMEELTMKNGSVAKSALSTKTTHSKKSHNSSHSQQSRTSYRSGMSRPDRFRDPRQYWYGTEGYDNMAFNNGMYGYMPGWRY